MFFLYLIVILIIVELITLIHESGHFLVAKKNGVRVAEFSIGFGPAIFQKTVYDTTYSFRWLPFGGYVSVLSDSIIEEIEKIKGTSINPMQKELIEKKTGGLKIDEDFSKQKTIDSISAKRRVLFATGGVLFNFASIFIILIVSYAFIGRGFSTEQIFLKFYNESGNVDNYYLINDIEYQTNSDPAGDPAVISGYDNMSAFLQSPENSKYDVAYNRDIDNNGTDESALLTMNTTMYNYDSDSSKITTMYLFTFQDEFSYTLEGLPSGNIRITGNKDNGVLILPTSFTTSEYSIASFNNGFPYYTEYQQYITLTGGQLIYYSLWDTIRYFWVSILWLVNFISLGFVDIGYHPTTSYLSQTTFLVSLLIFSIKMTVIFSALMIVFNMLPVPPLDGWRAYDYAYEGITKKKISKKTESTATKVGWGLIVAFFILGIII